MGTLTENKKKGDRDLRSGDEKAEEKLQLWHEQEKKKQGSGGTSRKVSSVLCEKRKENLA